MYTTKYMWPGLIKIRSDGFGGILFFPTAGMRDATWVPMIHRYRPVHGYGFSVR